MYVGAKLRCLTSSLIVSLAHLMTAFSSLQPHFLHLSLDLHDFCYLTYPTLLSSAPSDKHNTQ